MSARVSRRLLRSADSLHRSAGVCRGLLGPTGVYRGLLKSTEVCWGLHGLQESAEVS